MHTATFRLPISRRPRLRTLLLIAVTLAMGRPAWAGQSSASAASPTQPMGQLLELSMERAVEMGLETNLGLKADRMGVDYAGQSVALARASFLPVVTSSVSRSSRKSVPGDFTQGSEDITNQGVNVSSFLRQTLPLMGTSYSVQWNNSRNSQIGGRPPFNPNLNSTFSFNLTQPLLRGLRGDQNRLALANAERGRAIADVQLDQQMVRTETAVRNAYLDLISASEGLKVARQNLEIRQNSLNEARRRVEVGAAAPIDLISAEADVASNQEQVLLSEADIATREDLLRTLILDPDRPDYWQVHIVATDAMRPEPRQIDLDAAIKNALANRLDLIVAKRQLEISDMSLKVARDATRPGLDLQVGYGTTGTGGTILRYNQEFPPTVIDQQTKGFSSVLGDTFGAAYPQWNVGVNFSYALGRNSAQANLAQQQITRRQNDLGLRELEIVIVQQVRDAARQVENSYQRVLVTQTALRASEQQLDAEQRRFAAGLSTTLELQVRQGQLASARVAELNAVISHNRALINFDRIQKTQ